MSTSAGPPDCAWNRHKETILRLYLDGNDDNMDLKNVMQTMSRDYDFHASKSQYERYLKQWGIRKYLSKAEWNSLGNVLKSRKTGSNLPKVYMNGRLLPEKKVKREIRRNRVSDSVEISQNDADLASVPGTDQVPGPSGSGAVANPALPRNVVTQNIGESSRPDLGSRPEQPQPPPQSHSDLDIIRGSTTSSAVAEFVEQFSRTSVSEPYADTLVQKPETSVLHIVSRLNALLPLNFPRLNFLNFVRFSVFNNSAGFRRSQNWQALQTTMDISFTAGRSGAPALILDAILDNFVNIAVEAGDVSMLKKLEEYTRRRLLTGSRICNVENERWTMLEASSILYHAELTEALIPRTSASDLERLASRALELSLGPHGAYALRFHRRPFNQRSINGKTSENSLKRFRAVVKILLDAGANISTSCMIQSHLLGDTTIFKSIWQHRNCKYYLPDLDDYLWNQHRFCTSVNEMDCISIIEELALNHESLGEIAERPRTRKFLMMVLTNAMRHQCSDLAKLCHKYLGEVKFEQYVTELSSIDIHQECSYDRRPCKLKPVDDRHSINSESTSWEHNMRSKNEFSRSDLTTALESNNMEMTNLICKSRCFQAGTKFYGSDLNLALEASHFDAINLMLDLGVGVKYSYIRSASLLQNNQDLPLLAKALKFRDIRICQRILEHSGFEELSNPTQFGDILETAFKTNNIGFAQYLVDVATQRSLTGVSVLGYIQNRIKMWCCYPDIVYSLLYAGAGVRETDVTYAVSCEDLTLIRLVLLSFFSGNNEDSWEPSVLATIRKIMNCATYIGGHSLLGPFIELLDHRYRGYHTCINHLTPLHIAISQGDIEAVNLLFNKDDACEDDQYSLAVAASTNNPDMLRLLLKRGTNPASSTALYFAVTRSRACALLILDALKDRYSGVEKGFGACALRKAITLKDEYLISELVKVADVNGFESVTVKADVSWRWLLSMKSDMTPLGQAISDGYENVVQLLLSAGGDPNQVAAARGLTPLLIAVKHNNRSMVDLLLGARAEVNALDVFRSTRTPLQFAAQLGLCEMVQHLLAAGADVNGKPSFRLSGTALQLAAREGWTGLCEILLNAGADVNAEGSECRGRTALQYAAENGRTSVTHLLVKHGAHQDQFPKAIILAEKQGFFTIAKYLRTRCPIDKGWNNMPLAPYQFVPWSLNGANCKFSNSGQHMSNYIIQKVKECNFEEGVPYFDFPVNGDWNYL